MAQKLDPFNAAFTGNLEDLQRWYEAQPDKAEALKVRDKKHSWAPAIYTAASRGHAEMVSWLLEKGYKARGSLFS